MSFSNNSLILKTTKIHGNYNFYFFFQISYFKSNLHAKSKENITNLQINKFKLNKIV